MPWPKPSTEKTILLEHVLTGKCESKVLFGTPTWFVGGNIFAGIFGDDVFLWLTLADQVEIKELGSKPFEPMKRGAMKNYALLPLSILGDDKPLTHALAPREDKEEVSLLVLPLARIEELLEARAS